MVKEKLLVTSKKQWEDMKLKEKVEELHIENKMIFSRLAEMNDKITIQ